MLPYFSLWEKNTNKNQADWSSENDAAYGDTNKPRIEPTEWPVYVLHKLAYFNTVKVSLITLTSIQHDPSSEPLLHLTHLIYQEALVQF